MRILATNPTLVMLAREAHESRLMRAMTDALREDRERLERARRVNRIRTVETTTERARKISEKLRSRNRRHARKLATIRETGVTFASGFVCRPVAL